jgi:hypothetical protein
MNFFGIGSLPKVPRQPGAGYRMRHRRGIFTEVH